MVPHFKRLSDFILAKRLYMRALFMPVADLSRSFRRRRRRTQPSFSYLQIPFKPSVQTHIRPTLDPHQPRRD